MTFAVAVTGSVASGKSTVIQFFARKGIDIVSADAINRQLLKPRTDTFLTIVNHFGDKIVNSNGLLDKKALRNIIFYNKDEKRWLEELLHPIIRQQMEQQVYQASSPYVVVEIPLLKSIQHHQYIKRVLLIDVDKTTQLKRIIQRDNCSYKQAEAMIRNHPPFSEKRRLADDIIKNNGTKDELFAQLETLHERYCHLAGSK